MSWVRILLIFFPFTKQTNERTNELLYRAEGVNWVRIPLSDVFFSFHYLFGTGRP